MGQYHIGIGEGRGRGSHGDSGILGDVHVERLSRIDAFRGRRRELVADFMHAHNRKQASQTFSYPAESKPS